jgi:xanthine dehydrogenase YagT iron-sulfur-binding subunit
MGDLRIRGKESAARQADETGLRAGMAKDFEQGNDGGRMVVDEEQVASYAGETRRGAPCEWPVTRREFVAGATAVFGATTLVPALGRAETVPAVRQMPIKLTVNGEAKAMQIDPRTSLLDLLREDLKLTGTKKGCDHGQCGACTVLVDGRRINSCLALAVSYDGESVTTIEGIAKGEVLDPVQQAFLDHDGYQCGYCTPGQVVSAVALLGEVQKGSASYVTRDVRKTGRVELTDEEIKERMSGNLCRCGAYPGIVAAVRQAYGHTAGQASAQASTEEMGVTNAAL